MISVIDHVEAWQLEVGDSIEAFGEPVTVNAINDLGESIILTCTNDFDFETEIEVLPELEFPLLGYVEEEE